MKLVEKFTAAFDAENAGRLLEDNGIATFISSKRSHQLGGYFTGAFYVGLWVILDDQHSDARRLLSDPNHKVASKLGRTEIAQLKQSVHKTDMSDILKILFQLLAISALAAIGAYVFLYR